MNLKSIKILLLSQFALFFSLIAYNNVVDFDSNWLFVHHVLDMDTIFPHSALNTRAIHSLLIQKLAYNLIIFWELLIAFACWFSVIQLIRKIKSPSAYLKATQCALYSLSLAFTLYMLGFMIIGGEWFVMWQSSSWNGQDKAGLFLTLILLGMIFIAIKE